MVIGSPVLLDTGSSPHVHVGTVQSAQVPLVDDPLHTHDRSSNSYRVVYHVTRLDG